MADMTSIEKKDDGFYVTFRLLNKWEVWRLGVIMTAAADWQSSSRKEGSRWRKAGYELKQFINRMEAREKAYLRRPKRPSSDYPSQIDMDHVLYGSAPFPLLSVRDMRTVYPQLEARGIPARHIADRLRVHHRTVVRWRGETRRKKETR